MCVVERLYPSESLHPSIETAVWIMIVILLGLACFAFVGLWNRVGGLGAAPHRAEFEIKVATEAKTRTNSRVSRRSADFQHSPITTAEVGTFQHPVPVYPVFASLQSGLCC
jgi:hypothetical protein